MNRVKPYIKFTYQSVNFFNQILSCKLSNQMDFIASSHIYELGYLTCLI